MPPNSIGVTPTSTRLFRDARTVARRWEREHHRQRRRDPSGCQEPSGSIRRHRRRCVEIGRAVVSGTMAVRCEGQPRPRRRGDVDLQIEHHAGGSPTFEPRRSSIDEAVGTCSRVRSRLEQRERRAADRARRALEVGAGGVGTAVEAARTPCGGDRRGCPRRPPRPPRPPRPSSCRRSSRPASTDGAELAAHADRRPARSWPTP